MKLWAKFVLTWPFGPLENAPRPDLGLCYALDHHGIRTMFRLVDQMRRGMLRGRRCLRTELTRPPRSSPASTACVGRCSRWVARSSCGNCSLSTRASCTSWRVQAKPSVLIRNLLISMHSCAPPSSCSLKLKWRRVSHANV